MLKNGGATLSTAEGLGDAQNLLILTQNIFRKDFQQLQGDCQIASMGLNCISQIFEPEMVSQLYRELFALFTCSRPFIRKKVCALCYKIFLNSGENEDIIEEIIPYLSDRLKDSDPSVRMASISAIYEITKINQSLFIVTIPTVFQLLNETTNNWILIKLIKLLTEFAEVEPRLQQKLHDKFIGLIESQKAKSV